MQILVASRAVDLYGLAGPGGDGERHYGVILMYVWKIHNFITYFFFYICARSRECGK